MNYLKFSTYMLVFIFSLFSNAQTSSDHARSIYTYKINSIDGEEIELANFRGKKILFVNVASECGFTRQYAALQELYEKYKEKLVIIGFPCNQFGGQEPGTAREIQNFCRVNFGVEFLLTEKIDVKGNNQHPIYAWLTKKELNRKKNSSIKWNFQKYLVDEQGELIDYYYSMTKPMSDKITRHL